jgi:hypothetical protein
MMVVVQQDHVGRAVERDEAECRGDELTGLLMLERALEAPTRQIAANSDADGGVVVERMRKQSGTPGFDAAQGAYVDLIEHGIIDAAKVVRVALENAVSVAGTLLLTEATLTDVPTEPEDTRIVGRSPGNHGQDGPGPMLADRNDHRVRVCRGAEIFVLRLKSQRSQGADPCEGCRNEAVFSVSPSTPRGRLLALGNARAYRCFDQPPSRSCSHSQRRPSRHCCVGRFAREPSARERRHQWDAITPLRAPP